MGSQGDQDGTWSGKYHQCENVEAEAGASMSGSHNTQSML